MDYLKTIQELETILEALRLQQLDIEEKANKINGTVKVLQELYDKSIDAETPTRSVQPIDSRAEVVSDASGFFSMIASISAGSTSPDRRIIEVLREIGRASTKVDIDKHFVVNDKQTETRHAIKRLKSAGKLFLVSLGSSKKYSFWALPEWISDEYKLFHEFTPIVNGDRIDVNRLVVNTEMSDTF